MAQNPMQTYENYAYLIPIQTAINPPPLSHSYYADDGYDDDEYFKRIPVGYRFRPSDVELINEYLLKKINNQRLPRSRIHEVNLYACDPDYLAGNFKASGENEWYFFTPRQKKYKNGSRPNRAAGDGYWKATGADKPIVHNGEKIGSKKSLLYCRGEPMRGDRTSWLMIEYRVENSSSTSIPDENDMKLDDWVLCKVYINPRALSNNSNQIEKPTESVS